MVLEVSVIVALLVPAAPAGAVGLEPIGNYASPVYVTSDPDDEDRLFVVEREGRIMLTEAGQAATFVDLTSIVRSEDPEQGLLSMALAPDYALSGRLYVFYTGTDSGNLHVDELTATGASAADPASRREVVTIEHSLHTNHNGGQLQFGPDGYLYIATGDGGGSWDPEENAQDTTSLLGKLLRIDPRGGGGQPYAAPQDNPFVGGPGADEIWSYGLRNPWRFSFDRSSGALVIGDVGQSSWEEIDYEPSSVGGGRDDNFGWDCREALHTGEPGGCEGLAFTDPVHEYGHAGGNCSITGGYVSRDPGIPELNGRYVYADFCAGELRSASLTLSGVTDDRSEGLSVASPSSFGEDACGRLYVASLTGTVHRLVGAAPTVCDPPPSSSPPQPSPTGPCARVLVGTAADDVLEGSSAGERILGRGGGDRLLGRAGDDCLSGGRGADRLRGGRGDDEVKGGRGPDVARGGRGSDRLTGGRGRDELRGGRGRDLIDARGGGRDLVLCGAGRDQARVGPADRVRGCERVRVAR